MKKLQFLMIFLLPFSLFSQYTEMWKGDFNYDVKEKNSFASKIKIAPSKNLICVTSIGKTEKTIFTYFSLDGEFIKENRPWIFWEQRALNIQSGVYDEQYQALNSINKFDVNEAAIGFEFFSITKSKSDRKPFLIQLNLDTNQFMYVFYGNDDSTTRTRSYSAILGNSFKAIFADTVWFGYGNGEVKIQNYFLSDQTVDPSFVKNFLILSPDTISSDKSIANPVPVAIKRNPDSNLVVVIASVEQESTQAIGVSIRIVDKNFQEVKRFFLPTELFNLDGKLLSIKDAIVSEKSIYFVGNVYSFNNSSNALIAKCDLDGSNFKSTIITNEGSVFKSVEILNDTTILAVGASKDVNHQSNTHKFLAEFDEKVDVRFTKEWNTNNQDTLYDIERVNENEFIVVGSEDGFPFMEQLKKGTVSSVQTVPEISQDFGVVIPNPAKQHSCLQLRNSQSMEGLIKLYSFDGKFVKDLYVGTMVEQFQLPFSTINLSKGVYNIVVQTKNKQFFIPFVIGE